MKGYLEYKSLTAMQHEKFYSVFEKFLSDIRPERIIEIGTAGGGLTLALYDIMESLKLSVPIRTYDIHNHGCHDRLVETGIDARLENIFNENYELKPDHELIPHIQSPGVTVVLCDGGSKISEFNSIAYYLKPGDYILAHDYSESNEYFEDNVREKIWNWCEITESNISKASEDNGLERVMSEEFQSVVWVCKVKRKASAKKIQRPTIELSNKMPNFTLVTGLWDIKRDTLNDFGRPFDHYLDHFDKLLSLDFNMCVYVPDNLVSYVESRRSDKNTTIIPYNLENFKTNFDFFNVVQEIRTDENWYKRIEWLEKSPQAKLEYYNPIVMSKFFFVHDCAARNTFNTDHFFWIDGGLTNTVGLELLKNMTSLEDYMKSIKNKLLFLSFPYESDVEVHGFESGKFAEYCGVDKTTYVCRGGFFGGHKDRLKNFNGKYYGVANETLNSGYMGTEENFHTMLTYLHPQDTHRYELSSNGLIYPFFDMLKDVKKYNFPNAELIPWDKKKTAEDLKTSLYVLTFNSPKQFEALVESYIKNDPDFINRTRKILIDNSTEAINYPIYSELCQKYGFEHIKKEENLGICGARQFVAEHFNESNSEYYLFLEDDMTLNGPSDAECISGFSTYIEKLYMKSLDIIHKNQYDYLKLSYSEFYGTNSTQWAWYNVPQHIRDQYFPDHKELPREGLSSDPPETEIFKGKRHKDLKYFEGEFHYCNWPLWFSRQGNKKVFLDTKWAHPFEQTWMSHVFQLQKQGKIKAASLALSPILHHRFDFYTAEDRKEC